MELQNPPETGFFRKYAYFNSDFPFCIWREVDAPEQFGDARRFRRDFWKIIYVIAGNGTKVINEKRYPIQPGALFLIHPDDRTTFLIESDRLEICNIIFMPEMIREHLRELQDDFGFFSIFHWNSRSGRADGAREQLYIAEDDPEIRRLIRTMEREFDQSRQNYQPRLKLLLLELLILFARKSHRNIKHQPSRSAVDYVNHLISAHYAEQFKLDSLAAGIGIDKSRLCRIYRAETGMTIMDALRARRLERAAQLLREKKQRNISEICFGCGFNDLSYFYRCFTARYGMNPGTFRRDDASAESAELREK